MLIDIRTNFPEVDRALSTAGRQVPFALAVALNKVADAGATMVRREMSARFDRPTPYFLRSLRVVRATKQKPSATVWFKDKDSVESAETMVLPHVYGQDRKLKPMEIRLQRAGILPTGWRVVPGGGATLDAYGNMSRGQVSQILNVLNTYREAGYNKANDATRARLAKGNARKNSYGFVYWVNPVNRQRAGGAHLPPGVYKRVTTGFGTSLKPVLIFVSRTSYKRRLDFFGIVQRIVDAQFGTEFEKSFAQALRTARFNVQGSLFT